jgi:hypothetical protein
MIWSDVIMYLLNIFVNATFQINISLQDSWCIFWLYVSFGAVTNHQFNILHLM